MEDKLQKLLKKCTPKEQEFIQEYMKDFNATRAYKLCYPRAKETTAMACSARMIRKDKISAVLEEYSRITLAKNNISMAEILNKYKTLASANIEDYVVIKNGRVQIKDLSQIKNTYAIKEIKQGKNGIEFKLEEKQKALDSIARYFGMFIDKLEVSGKIETVIIDQQDAEL